jgi:hypothetical protein
MSRIHHTGDEKGEDFIKKLAFAWESEECGVPGVLLPEVKKDFLYALGVNPSKNYYC